MRIAALAVALIAALPAAQACEQPAGALSIGQGVFTVAAMPEPAPIEVGKHFALVLRMCPTAPARIVGVDAQMPAHRHGMNYAPRLVALADNAVRADGLMFHMPGIWRLTVEIEAGGKREYLSLDLNLE